MTKEQIETMLNEMDKDEREATINLDDALDKYMSVKLGKRFGVKIECNPDGDRSKIKIDGKVMGHEEFEKWYERRCMHESLDNFLDSLYEDDEDDEYDEEEYDEDDYDEEDDCKDEDDCDEEIEDDELPESVKIPYNELQDPYNDKEIRGYLRNKYGYYLKGNSYGPNIDCNDAKKIVYVTDIEWGRKR